MPPKRKSKASTKVKNSSAKRDSANSLSNQDGGAVNNARATRSKSSSAAAEPSTSMQAKAKVVKTKRAKSERIPTAQRNSSIRFQEDGQEMLLDVHANERAGEFGGESSDDEIDFNSSQASNTNASATASEIEGSSEDNSSQSSSSSDGEIESNAEKSAEEPPRKQAKKAIEKRSSVGETLQQVRQLVDKKGYIDAKSLEALASKLEGQENRSMRNLGVKVNPAPKRRAGGGDRETTPVRGGSGSYHKKTKSKVHFRDEPVKDKLIHEADSDVTIYRNAVKNKIQSKRASSSSDDLSLNELTGELNLFDTEQENLPNAFIAEIRSHYQEQKRRSGPDERRYSQERVQERDEDYYDRPHCSWEEGPTQQQQRLTPPEEKAEELIREAEAGRARIYGTPGTFNQSNQGIDFNNEYVHSVMVDETYMLVAAHLDEGTINKIEQGKYVDFAKLLARDRLLEESEPEYKMVIKGGRSYYVPAQETTSISNFLKWEQAFRVYSDIYTRVHPKRAAELIQYNHVIHSISLSYTWNNVYAYDVDFRIHMGKHPARSWAIILQMSWSFRLQDKIRHGEISYNGNRHFKPGSASKGGSREEPCRRFNRGHCTYGTKCKYDHRCSYCFKFGHHVLNCRKAAADREAKSSKDQPDEKPKNFN